MTLNSLDANVRLRACLHGVGDPGLVGLVSFVFTLLSGLTPKLEPTFANLLLSTSRSVCNLLSRVSHLLPREIKKRSYKKAVTRNLILRPQV